MNEKEIKNWIEKNLIMTKDSHLFTGQSHEGFKQTIRRGLIKPFVTLKSKDSKKPVHLFLKEDLQHYKTKKKKGENQIMKKIITLEEMKTKGIANFYGGIDENKLTDYAEELKAQGYDVQIERQESYSIIDGNTEVYNVKKKNKGDYFLDLNKKYGNDLEKLIGYYGVDGEHGFRKEFNNSHIKDLVDDLFRILFNLNNVGIPETSKNHTIEKTLGILSNLYLLDDELKK
ncbi:hypothetical protein RW115_11885 [Macrococcus capreoli]